MREKALRWLWILPLLLLVWASMGRLQSGSGDVAAQQASYTGWNEVARSPGGQYGWQTLGRWKRLDRDLHPAYDCDTANQCPPNWYRPTTGEDAYWWTPGFDDSSWSTQGYVDWHSAWTVYGWDPIPDIGRYVWKAEPGWNNNLTDLHRRWFYIPLGYRVTQARIRRFSDNHSEWFINGQSVGAWAAKEGTIEPIDPTPFHAGNNLLAVAVYNDNAFEGNNPFGIQYILEVYLTLDCPQNLNVTCGAGGTSVLLSWSSVVNAVSYVVRLNHDPFGDWFNSGGGDQWLSTSNTFATANIDPDVWYDWSVQGVESGESYPFQGCAATGPQFMCPSATDTPTPTPTPTATPTPTSTPVVSQVHLEARYPYLVYQGPAWGLPAQTLEVTVTGGGAPYEALFYIAKPGQSYQAQPLYTASSNPFWYGQAESGDPYFGVSELGTWCAQVVVDFMPSNTVCWQVSRYPVHVTR